MHNLLFVGDELAQIVGCPWTMRDSGGSLAQNRWQGDLGLTAVGQDNTGGGGHLVRAHLFMPPYQIYPPSSFRLSFVSAEHFKRCLNS